MVVANGIDQVVMREVVKAFVPKDHIYCQSVGALSRQYGDLRIEMVRASKQLYVPARVARDLTNLLRRRRITGRINVVADYGESTGVSTASVSIHSVLEDARTVSFAYNDRGICLLLHWQVEEDCFERVLYHLFSPNVLWYPQKPRKTAPVKPRTIQPYRFAHWVDSKLQRFLNYLDMMGQWREQVDGNPFFTREEVIHFIAVFSDIFRSEVEKAESQDIFRLAVIPLEVRGYLKFIRHGNRLGYVLEK